jgi:hypothetical protein
LGGTGRGDVGALDLDRIGGAGLRRRRGAFLVVEDDGLLDRVSMTSTPSSASKFDAARKRSVVSFFCSFSAILKVSRPSMVTPCSTLRMAEGASERCASMRARSVGTSGRPKESVNDVASSKSGSVSNSMSSGGGRSSSSAGGGSGRPGGRSNRRSSAALDAGLEGGRAASRPKAPAPLDAWSRPLSPASRGAMSPLAAGLLPRFPFVS